jgi:hypothetical protein
VDWEVLNVWIGNNFKLGPILKGLLRCSSPVAGMAGEGQSDNQNVDFPINVAIDEHAYSGGFIYDVLKKKSHVIDLNRPFRCALSHILLSIKIILDIHSTGYCIVVFIIIHSSSLFPHFSRNASRSSPYIQRACP